MRSPVRRGSWLVTFPSPTMRPDAALLVCLPQAGGGALSFGALQAKFDGDVEVIAIQLPGREQRWDEEAATSVDEVVAEVAPLLLPRLDRPAAIYGHSMGALLGFELARTLGFRHRWWPRALILAACRPPHLVTPEEAQAAARDEVLVGALRDEADAADIELDEDLIDELLAPMRADARACARYRHHPGPPLPCPVRAWAGRDDRAVTAEHVGDWQRYTSGPFEVECFPGGHGFHRECPDLVAAGIRRALCIPVAGGGHA
jgi:medium-chain acyl-[acyl-carrier-protein] hydrolase